MRSYVIRLASAVLRLGLVFLESVEQHTSCKAQVRKTRLRGTGPAPYNGGTDLSTQWDALVIRGVGVDWVTMAMLWHVVPLYVPPKKSSPNVLVLTVY